MAYIRSRKKFVQTALLSGHVATGLVITTAVHAEHQLDAKPVLNQAFKRIEVRGKRTPKQQGFKTNRSANNKYIAPLLDTAKSVHVISAQLLEDTQSHSLADALRTSPGITLGAGEGGNPNADRPFIRGFNAESSIYVDGVRSIGSQNREMFAIDSVEVTKGSASALGGVGSAGGSINLITKVPMTKDTLQGSVQYGTDNYQRIELDANKVLAESIAGRVALMGHKNQKAGSDDGAEYKRVGIAPSITFGMGTPSRATLSYYYVHSDDTPDSGIPYNNPFAATSPYAKFNGDGQPIDVAQGTYYGWKDRDFQQQDNQIATLNLQHDFNPDWSMTNVSSYSRSKNDYVWTNPDDSKGNFINKTTGAVDGSIWRRINNRIATTDTLSNQLFLKGRLHTGEVQHRFNTGIEYAKTDNHREQYLNHTDHTTTGAFSSSCSASAVASGWCTSVGSPTQLPWTGMLSTSGSDRYAITSKQLGVYMLDNIQINPQWLLDLGLRWDQFDTSSTMTYGAYNAAVLAKPPTQKAGDQLVLQNKNDVINYQTGLTFKPRPNGSVYVSYATSSNPVGQDFGDGSEGISAANANLKPEDVRTVELGTKWDVLNRKLNLTAALFRTDKTNTRVLNAMGLTENIGQTRTDGFELTANGKLTELWNVSAGYTYLNGQQIAAGMVNSGTTAQPIYTSNPANGKQIPQLAKHSATLWSTYNILPKLTIGGGAFYSDKVYGNTTNTKWVPSYVRYDAMARYAVDQHLDLQLNVNNLTDKRYFSKAYASHYATEAEGRSAVLSLNFKY